MGLIYLVERMLFPVKRRKIPIFRLIIFVVSFCGISLFIFGNILSNKCKKYSSNSTCIKNIKNQTFHKFNIVKNPKSTAKIHIAYVHFLNTPDVTTIENLKFFIHSAHDPCNSEVDYTIILNLNSNFYKQISNVYDLDLFKNAFSGRDHLEKFKSCESSENPLRNTYLVLRENKDGGDLCAFSDMIRNEFWLKTKAMYAYFFFINSSARGPFVPNYWLRKW